MDAEPRFVARDVHKSYVLIAALDAQLQVVLSPRRVKMENLATWVSRELRPSDRVVLEATINAWTIHDLLAPLVAEVQVAHPLLVKLISAARVKTDTRDTLHLARLLAAGLIPQVWVPPLAVRELRALVAHRARLVGQRTQATNRLHSVLISHNLAPPEAEAGWATLPLTPLEALRVQQDRQVVSSLTTLIHSVDQELTTLRVVDPWAGPMSYGLPISGVGIITGMTILAAIGEITRFPSAAKLVGYSGLGASVHASGQTFQTGKITKQGRRELRTALIEIAWSAVRHDPVWKARFEHLAARKGAGKAIVAIARKLFVVIWHVLTHQVAARQADPVRIIRKLWRVGYLGRTRHQFRVQPDRVCARPPRSVGSGGIDPGIRVWRTPLHVTCLTFTDRLSICG
jgi:transposase